MNPQQILNVHLKYVGPQTPKVPGNAAPPQNFPVLFSAEFAQKRIILQAQQRFRFLRANTRILRFNYQLIFIKSLILFFNKSII